MVVREQESKIGCSNDSERIAIVERSKADEESQESTSFSMTDINLSIGLIRESGFLACFSLHQNI